MAIRFDKNLNSEIAKTVKNYNRRLKRLQAQGVGLDLKTTTVNDLKASFDRRSDLLYALDRLNSIRGDQEALDEVLRKDITREKRKLNAEIKRREIAEQTPHFGLVQDNQLRYLQGQRAVLEKLSKFNYFVGKDREKINRILEKHVNPDMESKRRFYDNFMSMLFQTGYEIGYPKEKIQEMESKLKKLSPQQLLDEYNDGIYFKAVVENYHQFTKDVNDEGEIVSDDYYDDVQDFGSVLDQIYNDIDDIVDKYKTSK